MKLTQSDFILNAVFKGRRPLKHLRLRCTSSACVCPSLIRPMLLAAALLFAIASTAATSALAAFGILYTVNSTDDSPNSSHDAAPGNGVCEIATGNGVCTLRAAIEEANAHAGTDGIRFSISTTDPGYNAQTGTWTIKIRLALPDISTSMNIIGPGASALVIDAQYSDFGVFNVTTLGTVSFSGLTVTKGLSGDNASAGGINNANSGTVNITDCILSHNSNEGSGGAIYNAQNGTVNVTNSILEFNGSGFSGNGRGGGIANRIGTINVSNSSLFHNNDASGGGIYNSGVATVTGATFYENSAAQGGGIYNSGTLGVTNSTFYGNVASDYASGYDWGGGGIFNGGSNTGATLNLSNCTLTANFSGRGSGVFNDISGAVNVKSTIVAGNYGGTWEGGEAPDISGVFNSQGFNLIGRKDGSTGFTAATDKKGTIASPLNPKLDPKGLRNNGGPTQTVALVAGSPAIDKGTSAGLTGTLTTDQRGLARTVDNSSIANANGGDGTDIGAFEFGAQ